jgi:peptide/nickel transport system substrate-binding protein
VSTTSPSPTSPTRALRCCAIALALALVAGACGGGDDNGAAVTPGPDGGGEESEREIPPAAESEPVNGGTLVYALSAETDGWDPTGNQWGPWGLTVARTIYDTLTVFDEDGNIHPYLAESFEPNETYDVWDITLRPGVTFHNGEELTAQVLEDNWDFYADSPLVRRIFEQVADTEVIDELTMRVETTEKWVNFPMAWTTQVGVVMAPEMLNAPAEVRARNPIGTGPFEFVEWEDDNFLRVERNEDYWQEGLPHLSSIEFRIITDPTTRAASIRTGGADLAFMEQANEVQRFEEDSSVVVWRDPRAETAENFVMLNTLNPPLDDPRVRRALVHATDRETVNQVISEGLREVADGPYRPSSPWYAETDYPDYDLDEARRLVEAYEAEVGPVAFTLEVGASGADGLLTSQLLQEQWQQAGIDVNVGQTEISTFILDVVLGSYDAVLWRQFDSPHPMQESVWWSEDTVEDLGEFGLNFARNRNATLTEALEAARAAESREEETEHYAVVQRELATDIPYIWLTHVEPTIVASERVANVFHAEIPDQPGTRMMSVHNSSHTLHQVWLQ